jgi:hypothetical protein
MIKQNTFQQYFYNINVELFDWPVPACGTVPTVLKIYVLENNFLLMHVFFLSFFLTFRAAALFFAAHFLLIQHQKMSHMSENIKCPCAFENCPMSKNVQPNHLRVIIHRPSNISSSDNEHFCPLQKSHSLPPTSPCNSGCKPEIGGCSLEVEKSLLSSSHSALIVAPTSADAFRRAHRHSIPGHRLNNYLKFLHELAAKGSTTAHLFSTAVISGSSSAPNLKEMPRHGDGVGKKIYTFKQTLELGRS